MNPYTSMWTGVTPGDGPQDVPPDPGRQRPVGGAVRRPRPRRAELHPLLGLPQRLPGLRAGRRARVRLGLSRADRRHPVAAADRGGGQRVAAVRELAVRGLLRRLPGQDQHPGDPGPPAGRARRGAGGAPADADRRGRADAHRVLGDARPEAVGPGPAVRPARPAARPPARGDRRRAGADRGAVDRDPRPAAAAAVDVPRLVGPRAQLDRPRTARERPRRRAGPGAGRARDRPAAGPGVRAGRAGVPEHLGPGARGAGGAAGRPAAGLQGPGPALRPGRSRRDGGHGAGRAGRTVRRRAGRAGARLAGRSWTR